MPMLYFGDEFFRQSGTVYYLPEGWIMVGKTTKESPSHEAPPKENGASNALYVGTELYADPELSGTIYAKLGENEFIVFKSLDEKSSSKSTASIESSVASSYSNPYEEGCLTESYASESSGSSKESFSHSSQTSSNFAPVESKFIPKAKATAEPVVLPAVEGKFGTAEELEEWKNIIMDVENIHEIVIQFVVCEERYISVEETSSLLEELQTKLPVVYEQPENPPTGGSYFVTAYGASEEIIWSMSWGGFYTVYIPENEVPLYFDGSGIYLESLVKICDYKSLHK